MERTIFVGSSHEGLVAAQKVCDALKALDESLDPQLWTKFFPAGSLTFQALEDMLQRCCAAVFVVRGDDIVKPVAPAGSAEGSPEYMPRGNVLVEFGLVAGRMGHRNVALCRVGPADLPSDLAGMTTIDMCPKGNCPETPHTDAFTSEALGKLGTWALGLLPTVSTVERTLVLHGYTGRWEFELRLRKWRGLPINDASFAVVYGNLDLFITSVGLGSIGSASGRLSCSIAAPDGNVEYMSELLVFHTTKDIVCNATGGLDVISQLVATFKSSETGTAPKELRAVGAGSEPWRFNWSLSPSSPGHMEGKVETSASGGTEGDITAWKLRMIH